MPLTETRRSLFLLASGLLLLVMLAGVLVGPAAISLADLLRALVQPLWSFATDGGTDGGTGAAQLSWQSVVIWQVRCRGC